MTICLDKTTQCSCFYFSLYLQSIKYASYSSVPFCNFENWAFLNNWELRDQNFNLGIVREILLTVGDDILGNWILVVKMNSNENYNFGMWVMKIELISLCDILVIELWG